MRIRKVKEGEKELLIAIEKKELYPELSLGRLRAWINGEGDFAPLVAVAEEKREIVGFTVLEPYEIKGKELILQLDTIVIEREFQEQGIGRRLLETALEETKTHWQRAGFRVVGLLIKTIKATSFYERVFPQAQKSAFENVWGDGQPMFLFFVPL